MANQEAVAIAGVMATGVAAQWLGWRVKIPAIVFLLAIGLIAGPITGTLHPDEVFGRLLIPSVSLAVAVILFEGSLDLGWQGVRRAGATVWLLLSVGMLITLFLTVLCARWVLGVDWDLAFLLGSVLVVTGPTVIGPIVKSVRLPERVASLLEAEGTLIDSIGAILTVLVFQAFFGEHSGVALATDLLTTLAVGILLGAVAAALVVVGLMRYLVPDHLQNVSTLAIVIVTFVVSNELREESGLVAVTVMGILLATQNRVSVRHVLHFSETLRILFISGLFILLGARIQPETLREVEWRNVAFLLVLVVLVRPISVFISMAGSRFKTNERVFVALTAPRGIVAAAIASVFSLRLAEIGVENSQILVSATFTVIAGTVLLCGLGSSRLAQRLNLLGASTQLFVVLGANPVARALASALRSHDAEVHLVDLDRKKLSRARLSGLIATHGSALSEEIWEEVEIHAASGFLALTTNDELNTLAARRVADEIGKRNVFQLVPKVVVGVPASRLPAGTFARSLFETGATMDVLSERLARGAKISSTLLTQKFGPEEFRKLHPEAIPLFFVSGSGEIELVATDGRLRYKRGDRIVSLGGGASGGAGGGGV